MRTFTDLLQLHSEFVWLYLYYFQQYDKDGSGALDLYETKKLVSRLCQNMMLPPVDDETLTTLFHRYDFSGDGVLMFDEFKDMYFFLLCRIRDKFYPNRNLKINRKNFIRHTELKNEEGVASIHNYFQFDRKLGQGSFGEVHLVTERKSRIQRVCKTINKSKSQVPVEQIQAEIKIMKELDHPNIIKIFDVLEDGHNIYIVMEYCQGGELLGKIASIAQRKQKFSERFVCDVMRQILSALSYIHRRRVIHKDLKPENILFFSSAPDSVLKVIDFGLAEMFNAQVAGDQPPAPELMSANAAGTALYMAPEVFQRKFNFKCDIWSAGVMLYMLLSGRLPFMGKTVEDVKRKVMTAPLPIERDLKGCSPDAISLIEAMLTKEHTKRPTAEECLESPWFMADGHSEDIVDLPVEIAEALRAYMKQSQLKQALTNMFAHSSAMSHKKVRSLQTIFAACDRDHSGTLSAAELTEALERAGIAVWDSTRIVEALDVDGDKMISYTEFAAALWQWEEAELNQVWGHFQRMDLDGDGRITVEEFFEVLLGEEGKSKLLDKHEEFDEMVKQIDLNNDGMIDWDEFVAFVKSH